MALQGFDKDYYLQAKYDALVASGETEWLEKTPADLEETLLNVFGLTAEEHYSNYGWAEGLAPNAYFDADEYKAAKVEDYWDNNQYLTKEDAEAAFEASWPGDAYEHYLMYGAAEGINPSNAFDESAYLADKLAALQAADPATWDSQSIDDVRDAFADAGLSALGHFLAYGQDEGLTATPVAEEDQVGVDPVPEPAGGEVFALTVNQDILTDGTDADDTFFADVVQFEGAQVNSLATGDMLNGQGGDDMLEAQLTEGVFMGGGNMPIQPRTASIETVKIEALNSGIGYDLGDSFELKDMLENGFQNPESLLVAETDVYLNAKNMTDIDALWSWHSDANLTVQNLTTLEEDGTVRQVSDMTIGMGYTGNADHDWNEADFSVYFDQDYLNPELKYGDQTVSYRLMNEDGYDDNPTKPLSGVFVERLEFTLNNQSFDLADYLDEDQFGDGTEIETYLELRDALRDALDELIADNPDVPELSSMVIDLGGSFTSDNNRVGTEITFTVPGLNADGEENELVVSEFFAQLDPAEGDGAVENSNRFERAATEPVDQSQELRINIALEKAGLAGDGGELIVGSMSKDGYNVWSDDSAEKGIEAFDVTVYGDDSKPSSLAGLRSTNNTLQEITVTTDAEQTGSFADLTIGNSESIVTPGQNVTADKGFGIKDVQTFDATDFKGDLSLTAQLTEEIIPKYLDLQDDQADHTVDNVLFSYIGGSGNDLFDIVIDGDIPAREDFSFNVTTNDGDDTVITDVDYWTWNSREYLNQTQLNNLSINTGMGNDTVTTMGSADFIIDTGVGNDTVYTDNTGNRSSGSIREVQTITFGEAGDLATDGQVTVTLANGQSVTITDINTGDTAGQVATNIAGEINGSLGGWVTANATGVDGVVTLTYNTNMMSLYDDYDVPMATVTGIATDITASVADTTASDASTFVAETTETATITFSAATAVDGQTLVFVDGAGTTTVTLTDTDQNGDVSLFEITQQVGAATFTNWTVTSVNPSIDEIVVEAKTAGAIADFAENGTGTATVTDTPTNVTQGVDGVAETGTTGEVQTVTITNGADQAGQIFVGLDVDGSGAVDAGEVFTISVGAGNEADVAADVAAGINAIAGVSAVQGAASPDLDDVIVTFDGLGDAAAITIDDGAVRSASVVETVKGEEATAGNPATWVVNSQNLIVADLLGNPELAPSLLYKSTVTVTLSEAYFGGPEGVTNPAADAAVNGFESTVTIPTLSYVGNQYEVNQAIKEAINQDDVLSKFLVAEDGPSDTLIITSLVDGRFAETDLAIDIDGPASLSVTELNALNAAYQNLMNDSTLELTEGQMLAHIAGNAGALDAIYSDTELGTTWGGTDYAGNSSQATSDNVIDLGAGDDVLVMGTGALSNDTLMLTGDAIGNNTVLNFVADQDSAAADYLDLSEYLTNAESASGSTASTAQIADSLTFATNGALEVLSENEVVFINDFASAPGESWDNLTGENLLAAITDAGSETYGSIDENDLDVANASAALVGTEIKNMIFVENDDNAGEYKVFDVTSSASSDEFTDAHLLGTVDFGAEINAATGATDAMIIG